MQQDCLWRSGRGGESDRWERRQRLDKQRVLFIGARSLAAEPLVGALQSARRNGIDIVVLDDLGDIRPSTEGLARAIEWCANLISGERASSITIRIAPFDAVQHAEAIVTVSIDGQPAQTILVG